MLADEIPDGKMLPDMQHKITITLTWHSAVRNKMEYLLYKHKYHTKKSSAYNQWVVSLFIVANLIKPDIDDKAILIKLSQFDNYGSLNDSDFIIIHDYLTDKLSKLGLLDLKIDRVSPTQKYAGMFK
jgi:hypothetical protein